MPKKNVPTLPSITYPADFRFLYSHRVLTSVWLSPRTWYVHASGVCIALSSTLGRYLLDKSWAPFPTYPVVLPFKGQSFPLSQSNLFHPSRGCYPGTSQDVVNFRQLMTGGRAVPGLPKFDPNRGVCIPCATSDYSASLKQLLDTGAR